MAVVRTGPRDAESRTRDIGPAGSGVDGLSAVGRLSALRVSDVVGDVAAGYGEIERRQATPEELARLDAPEPVKPTAETRPGPAMHVLRPTADRMAASRMRGNERMLELAGKRPASTGPKEELMVTAAALEVPCGTCLHEPVCSLKASIPASAGEPIAVQLAPGLRQYVQGFRIECDHQLVSLRPVEPEPIRAEYGGERWRSATPEEVSEPRQPGRHDGYQGEAAGKADRAAKVVAAVARNGGDKRAAADELGMKLNALSMVLKYAGRQQTAEATA
jgi:hypothetical protein